MAKGDCKKYMHLEWGRQHPCWRRLFSDLIWTPERGHHRPGQRTWKAKSCVQKHNGAWVFDVEYCDASTSLVASCSYQATPAGDCPDGFTYSLVRTAGRLPPDVEAPRIAELRGDSDPPS